MHADGFGELCFHSVPYGTTKIAQYVMLYSSTLFQPGCWLLIVCMEYQHVQLVSSWWHGRWINSLTRFLTYVPTPIRVPQSDKEPGFVSIFTVVNYSLFLSPTHRFCIHSHNIRLTLSLFTRHRPPIVSTERSAGILLLGVAEKCSQQQMPALKMS